jgi:hypothetical protein
MEIFEGIKDSAVNAAQDLGEKISDLLPPITKEEIVYSRKIIK